MAGEQGKSTGAQATGEAKAMQDPQKGGTQRSPHSGRLGALASMDLRFLAKGKAKL